MTSPSLLRTALPLLAFVLALAGTGGVCVTAAENKAPPAAKKNAAKAPAAKKDAKSAPAAAEADTDSAKRPPLKLAVDTKPIDRDAAERVSYAPVVKRTAASVVYVHSSKRVRRQDMSSFFNDPRFRRFFDGLGIPRPEGDEDAAPTPPSGRGNNRAAPRNRAPRSPPPLTALRAAG